MNRLVVVGALALLLVVGVAVYIGSADGPPSDVVVAPEPESTAETVEQQTADDQTGAASDEAQIVVEESAAEPEADEQPLMLARADTGAPQQSWQYTEGEHYTRIVPSQPTMGGAGKIEVAEFFWYGCPHCYSFEPTINAWAAEIPPDVRFVRIPVTWNAVHELHARLFYTKEVLGRNGVLQNEEDFHTAVFEEIQQRGNRLTSEDAIRRLFERFGVSGDAFDRTWKSFEVDQKLRVAKDLARRYSIASVPSIVVNGKFRTGGAEAGSYDAVPHVINELIARESQR